MPPLRRTTAREWFVVDIENYSDPLHRRVPDELVQLQTESGRYVIGEHPLGQFLGVKQTVRTVAGAGRVFAKRRGKKDSVHVFRQMMFASEPVGKVVVGAAAQDKLDFVLSIQALEVLHTKRVALAGVRTFHIDDLDDSGRNPLQRALSAGLKQNFVTAVQEPLHQRHDIALLQHGFATGDLNQTTTWT